MEMSKPGKTVLIVKREPDKQLSAHYRINETAPALYVYWFDDFF